MTGPNVEIDPVKYGVMWQQVQTMDKRMERMEKQIDQLLEMANKSRGGLWLGITLVSSFSALVAIGTSIINSLKGH